MNNFLQNITTITNHHDSLKSKIRPYYTEVQNVHPLYQVL
jgi:hypothetical protein